MPVAEAAPRTTMTENEAARLLALASEHFGEGGGLSQIKAQIAALESQGLLDPKKVDVKALVERVEKIWAAQEALRETLRSGARGKNPLAISGVGEEPFSLSKTLVAYRRGGTRRAFESVGAGHEYEVCRAASLRHEKLTGYPTPSAAERASKAMTAADDESLGLFIPDQVLSDVVLPIYTRSAFVALDADGETSISVLDGLVGENVRIKKLDGGVVAYWLGEEESYLESALKAGDLSLKRHKLGALVVLTDELLKGMAPGVDRLIARDMAKALAKKLDWTVAYGLGQDAMPLGIMGTKGIKILKAEGLPATLINGVDSLGSNWAGAPLTFTVLNEMRLRMEEDNVDEDSSFKFVTAPRSLHWLKELRVENYSSQTTGLPYLLGAPVLSDARLADIAGAPIGKTSQITLHKPGETLDSGLPVGGAAAKFTDVFGGNLAEILLGRWAGIEVVDDAGKYQFLKDSLYVKTRMYVDVGIRQPRAIVVCADAKVTA